MTYIRKNREQRWDQFCKAKKRKFQAKETSCPNKLKRVYLRNGIENNLLNV